MARYDVRVYTLGAFFTILGISVPRFFGVVGLKNELSAAVVDEDMVALDIVSFDVESLVGAFLWGEGVGSPEGSMVDIDGDSRGVEAFVGVECPEANIDRVDIVGECVGRFFCVFFLAIGEFPDARRSIFAEVDEGSFHIAEGDGDGVNLSDSDRQRFDGDGSRARGEAYASGGGDGVDSSGGGVDHDMRGELLAAECRIGRVGSPGEVFGDGTDVKFSIFAAADAGTLVEIDDRHSVDDDGDRVMSIAFGAVSEAIDHKDSSGIGRDVHRVVGHEVLAAVPGVVSRARGGEGDRGADADTFATSGQVHFWKRDNIDDDRVEVFPPLVIPAEERAEIVFSTLMREHGDDRVAEFEGVAVEVGIPDAAVGAVREER